MNNTYWNSVIEIHSYLYMELRVQTIKAQFYNKLTEMWSHAYPTTGVYLHGTFQLAQTMKLQQINLTKTWTEEKSRFGGSLFALFLKPQP